MFSVKPRLKSSLLIILIISKSIQKKVLNLQLALYTLFQHQNKRLSKDLLRKTSIQVSSDQLSSLYNVLVVRVKNVGLYFILFFSILFSFFIYFTFLYLGLGFSMTSQCVTTVTNQLHNMLHKSYVIILLQLQSYSHIIMIKRCRRFQDNNII